MKIKEVTTKHGKKLVALYTDEGKLIDDKYSSVALCGDGKHYAVQYGVGIHNGRWFVLDENGKRELRLFDNDISHLKAGEVSNYGRNYAKLGYEVNNHYLLLKNSLSDKDNEGLQNTAKEVEYRYVRYKKRILWKTLNDNWVGYKLTNRGPINEAFTAFYIRSIQLNNSLNENINTFMTYPRLGVISADNANGFLIGDVSMGGV